MHGLDLTSMSWSKYNTLSQHCHTLLANEKTAAVAAELLNLVQYYSCTTAVLVPTAVCMVCEIIPSSREPLLQPGGEVVAVIGQYQEELC